MAKKRALQKFKKSDLDNRASTEQVAIFLHDFMAMAHGQDSKTKMISIRVPENILNTFRLKARSEGIAYQSKIVSLMRAWAQLPADE